MSDESDNLGDSFGDKNNAEIFKKIGAITTHFKELKNPLIEVLLDHLKWDVVKVKKMFVKDFDNSNVIDQNSRDDPGCVKLNMCSSKSSTTDGKGIKTDWVYSYERKNGAKNECHEIPRATELLYKMNFESKELYRELMDEADNILKRGEQSIKGLNGEKQRKADKETFIKMLFLAIFSKINFRHFKKVGQEEPAEFHIAIYDKTVEKIKILFEDLEWLGWDEITNSRWDKDIKVSGLGSNSNTSRLA